MKKLGTFLIGLALLTGCGNGMPEDIIQPEQMEEILYDYHLSIGMSRTHQNSNENYHREAFKQYVFKKHQVTEALFDTSMVWYTRNAKELSTIYENLDKRLSREHAHMETLMVSRQEGNRNFLSGDTVDVWTQGSIYWLNQSPLSNQLNVEIIADTTFHANDAFLWSIDYHFFKDAKVAMGLNVIYDNDSVVGETKLITESGKHTIYLHADSAYQIKTLNGFVYLMEDSIQRPNVLLNNITLNRYHVMNDTLAVTGPVQVVEAPAAPVKKELKTPASRKEPQAPSVKKDFKSSLERKKRNMENIQIVQ